MNVVQLRCAFVRYSKRNPSLKNRLWNLYVCAQADVRELPVDGGWQESQICCATAAVMRSIVVEAKNGSTA